MFPSNKYINRSFSVFTNNVQTTNCTASNILTNNILNLNMLGINNNNPRFTLDVNGNINFTGNLYKNNILYSVGAGYWNLIGNNITNTNIGSVIVNTSLNVNQNLNVSGTSTLTGNVGINTVPTSSYNLNVSGNTNISNLLTVKAITLTATSPVYNSNSVVPKSYVDTLASGIVLLGPCVCATTSSADGVDWIYNGTSEFTNVSTTLVLDGYTVQYSDRVLIKDQLNEVENGIYEYDDISGTLTRVSDFSYGQSANSVVTFVQYGTVNVKTSFLQTTNPATVGINNLVFVQLNSYDFKLNNTLQLIGNTLGVNPNLEITTITTSGQAIANGGLSVVGTGTINGDNIITSSSLSGYALLNSSPNFTGQVTAVGGFVSGSDYRIKENIIQLDSSYTVDKLNPIKFTNKNTGKTDIGLIAHELQEFYPDLVTGEKDDEQLQTVNYQGLIGILIQEIKSLKQEVKELKEKVNI